VGKVLVVPVKSSPTGIANGVFMYFDNGTDRRMKFVSRHVVEGKIAENRLAELSGDEVFAYRNFLLTDLKNPESRQAMPTMNLAVFFEGYGESATVETECEGGAYEFICFYNTSRSDDLDIRARVRLFMDENYGAGDHISRDLNGATIADLEANYNTILNGLPWDERVDFVRYFNDRQELFSLTGIDNELSGILWGIVVELERTCFWVWVWCWEDPFDFSIGGGGTSGGGGGGSIYPAWQTQYDTLRFCEGVNDLFDIGPENPSMVHPNFDFCTTWMTYLEDCILPTQPAFNEFEYISSYEQLILTWAEFQYNNPTLFAAAISNPEDCTATSELDDFTPETDVLDEEECRNALSDFERECGLALNRHDQEAILSAPGRPDCGDEAAFEEWVVNSSTRRKIQNQLSQRPEELSRVTAFLDQHDTPDVNERNLSLVIASAYADLMSDSELNSIVDGAGVSNLDMGEVGNPGDPIWDFMKAALLESLKEALIDLIPGATLATLGPELFDDLQSGNWLDAMFNAANILIDEADVLFPAAKVCSAAATLFVTGKQLKTAFDAFKKAKSLGEAFLLKLYNIFTVRLGWSASDIRDKFQSIEGIGAKIEGFIGNDFYQKLKDEFDAEITGILDLPSPPNSGLPFWKIQELPAGNAIYMIAYPVSSQGYFSIKLYTGGTSATSSSQLSPKFALRFDY